MLLISWIVACLSNLTIILLVGSILYYLLENIFCELYDDSLGSISSLLALVLLGMALGFHLYWYIPVRGNFLAQGRLPYLFLAAVTLLYFNMGEAYSNEVKPKFLRRMLIAAFLTETSTYVIVLVYFYHLIRSGFFNHYCGV